MDFSTQMCSVLLLISEGITLRSSCRIYSRPLDQYSMKGCQFANIGIPSKCFRRKLIPVYGQAVEHVKVWIIYAVLENERAQSARGSLGSL